MDKHEPSIITTKFNLMGVTYWEASCRLNGKTVTANALTSTGAIDKLKERINDKDQESK